MTKCGVCGKPSDECPSYSMYMRFIEEMNNIHDALKPMRQLLSTQFKLVHPPTTGSSVNPEQLVQKMEDLRRHLNETMQDEGYKYRDFCSGQINGLGLAISIIKTQAGIED